MEKKIDFETPELRLIDSLELVDGKSSCKDFKTEEIEEECPSDADEEY